MFKPQSNNKTAFCTRNVHILHIQNHLIHISISKTEIHKWLKDFVSHVSLLSCCNLHTLEKNKLYLKPSPQFHSKQRCMNCGCDVLPQFFLFCSPTNYSIIYEQSALYQLSLQFIIIKRLKLAFLFFYHSHLYFLFTGTLFYLSIPFFSYSIYSLFSLLSVPLPSAELYFLSLQSWRLLIHAKKNTYILGNFPPTHVDVQKDT